MTSMITSIADSAFSKSSMYRRVRGGYWVKWLTPEAQDIWLRNDYFRPEWARGTPVIEDYTSLPIVGLESSPGAQRDEAVALLEDVGFLLTRLEPFLAEEDEVFKDIQRRVLWITSRQRILRLS